MFQHFSYSQCLEKKPFQAGLQVNGRVKKIKWYYMGFENDKIIVKKPNENNHELS